MSSVNNIMHEHINKLRIISKIRPGQKLDTTSGITVYEESIFNWLYRKYYRDSKDEAVRILQEIYKSIDRSTEQLLLDFKNVKDKNKLFKLITIIINLAENIKSSITGIENLSKTYVQYPKTVATLEGIIQDFAIVSYTQLLESIPEEKLTKNLRENINYMGVVLYLGKNSILFIENKEDSSDNSDID